MNEGGVVIEGGDASSERGIEICLPGDLYWERSKFQDYCTRGTIKFGRRF